MILLSNFSSKTNGFLRHLHVTPKIATPVPKCHVSHHISVDVAATSFFFFFFFFKKKIKIKKKFPFGQDGSDRTTPKGQNGGGGQNLLFFFSSSFLALALWGGQITP
jgi:hypothetical protein